MEEVKKWRILPKFSKEDFLRKVWEAFADEDAPIELFRQDLGAVKEKEYEVLIDTISADVSYNASIGYDRQEAYIDYERYYEEEPYLTTETYYDYNTRSRRTRQVTKYKRVAKERPVTKYKTVTDWSLFSDSRTVNNTTACVTNKNYSDFDMETFRECYKQTDRSEFAVISGGEAAAFNISRAADAKAEKRHGSAIQRSVANSLPGDRYKDLDCTYSVTERASALFKLPMYETSVNFNGKTYTKYAFPFGDELKICGDQIENVQSVESVKSQTYETLDKNARKRRGEINDRVWKKTGFVEVFTMLLLAASVAVSVLACILKESFLHNMAVIGIAIGAAAVFFVFNFILDKLVDNKETRKAEAEIRKEKEAADEKLAHFKENHLAELQEALRKKLNALGNGQASKTGLE